MNKVVREKLVLRWIVQMLLILGGFNCLLISIFGIDIIKWLINNELIVQIVYSLIGLAALDIAFEKDTWQPFIAPTMIPTIFDNIDSTNNRNFSITLDPFAKRVIYWVREISNLKGWVIDINEKEKTTTNLLIPQNIIDAQKVYHIQYRFVYDNGLLSKIHSIKVNNNF